MCVCVVKKTEEVGVDAAAPLITLLPATVTHATHPRTEIRPCVGTSRLVPAAIQDTLCTRLRASVIVATLASRRDVFTLSADPNLAPER